MRSLSMLVEYVVEVGEEITVESMHDVLDEAGESTEEVAMTLADRLRQEGRLEERQKAIQERHAALVRVASRLLAEGMTPEKITEMTELPLQEVLLVQAH